MLLFSVKLISARSEVMCYILRVHASLWASPWFTRMSSWFYASAFVVFVDVCMVFTHAT